MSETLTHTKDIEVTVAPSEEEVETRDANLRKLDAENAIGVLATLIAGFSLAMIPAVEKQDDCETNDGVVRTAMYIHVLLLAVVSFCSSVSVIFTTGLYFKGQKLLSKRISKNPLSKQLRDFDKFWDGHKDSRGKFRQLFLLSIPLFLLAVAASPTVWCADQNLGIALCVSLGFCAMYCWRLSNMMLSA